MIAYFSQFLHPSLPGTRSFVSLCANMFELHKKEGLLIYPARYCIFSIIERMAIKLQINDLLVTLQYILECDFIRPCGSSLYENKEQKFISL